MKHGPTNIKFVFLFVSACVCMLKGNIKGFSSFFPMGPATDFDYVQALFLEYRNTALCSTVLRLHIERSTVA